MRDGSSVSGAVWGGERVRMARSLGFHVDGAAPLVPDVQDLETSCRGAQHRFLRDTPAISRHTARRFRCFVRKWIRMNLRPLDANTDTSVEAWLEGTNYPLSRKLELFKWDGEPEKDKYYVNKMFRKRECYPEPKHARQINSRHDWFKTRTGPIFKKIEHELFKRPEFVKTVPVVDRAQYINDLLYCPGSCYLSTDHTSFEAHMHTQIMKCCEMQLYSYMVRDLPDKDWFRIVNKGLCSVQKCLSYNNFGRQIAIGEARLSGDMCTSLGNGFTNLMVMLYVAQAKGWGACVGVVEGDDGLFRVSGDVPTDQDFADVGFTIKSVTSDSVGQAGFCHLFNAEDQYENLVDPIMTTIKVGWTLSPQLHGGPKVMEKLARAKAMSMVCEAPANPITSQLALWILRCTRGEIEVGPNEPDRWYRLQCLKRMDECQLRAKLGPTKEQREFVADKWGISVSDQVHIENWFANQDRIRPIRIPVLMKHVPKWLAYSYDNFLDIVKKGHSWRS